MPDSGEIVAMIRGLGEADRANRERAAAEIFARGCELARAASQGWLDDPDLRALLIRGEAGSLEVTVGIAVEPSRFERIRAACGSPRLASVPPDQDAMEFEIEFPGGVKLDVLRPRQPDGDGAIARFLKKFGEAIQQVEIPVLDVGRATEILRDRFAVTPIYPSPRPGADGARVNFFLATAGSGKKVLIELVEAHADTNRSETIPRSAR
ncbi:MAG TPA: hypothetical protein VJO53_04070 [Candidatus Acidoferrales bacterium]|nr:hypothetical protein [Candidatus Acidoferrales bacterium]